MPQTPKLGLRYPDRGDTPRGPQAFADLATDIEKSHLVSPIMRSLYRTTPNINVERATWTTLGPGWTSGEGDYGDQSGILYSNGVMQFTKPGIYLVSVALEASTGGEARFIIRLLRNGSPIINRTSMTPVDGGTGFLVDYVRFDAGDTAQIAVWLSNATTPRQITGGDEARSRWGAEYRYPL